MASVNLHLCAAECLSYAKSKAREVRVLTYAPNHVGSYQQDLDINYRSSRRPWRSLVFCELFACNSVMIAIQIVDVVSKHPYRSAYVRRSIAASAGAIDIGCNWDARRIVWITFRIWSRHMRFRFGRRQFGGHRSRST